MDERKDGEVGRVAADVVAEAAGKTKEGQKNTTSSRDLRGKDM